MKEQENVLIKKICDIFEDVTGLHMDCMKVDVNLTQELGVDSFDLILLFSELEKQFGLEFSYDEMEDVHSIIDLVRYIELKKS